MGGELAEVGLGFVIFDGGDTAGHTWRDRWTSLRLFTPAATSATCPGTSSTGTGRTSFGKLDATCRVTVEPFVILFDGSTPPEPEDTCTTCC